MNFESCHGNLTTFELALARDIAEDYDTEEECWEALDNMQCPDKCGKCNQCVTVERIYETGLFLK